MNYRRSIAKKLILMVCLCLLLTGSWAPNVAQAYEKQTPQGFESVLVDSGSTVVQEVYQELPAVQEGNTLEQKHKMVREDLGKRTRNSKTYIMDNGSFQTILDMEDEHYVDVNGLWQEIQLELTDEADAADAVVPLSKDASRVMTQFKATNKMTALNRKETNYKTLQTPYDLTLPKRFIKGYSIERKTEKLTFLPIGANSVTGTIYGKQQVLYPQAWEDTDVILEARPSGIKESIILKSNLAPTTFSFEMIGYEGIGNELQLADPWLEDAVGVRRDVQQEISKEGNKTILTLHADTSGLVFPIVVDPTVMTVSANQDFYGSCNYYATQCFGMNTTTLVFGFGSMNQTMISFDVTSVPVNATITSASLDLYWKWAETYTNKYLSTVYRVIENWYETGLQIPRQPAVDFSNPIVNKYIALSEGNTNWDITNAVKKWVSGEWVNYGIAIRSNGEEAFQYHSKEGTVFGPGPKLTINYNLPSGSPKILSPNGGETFDGQHTITWAAAVDPDNVQNSLSYQLQFSANGGASWTDLIARTGAGVISFGYNFSSTADTNNALVRVRAFDGIDYGPWDQSDGVFAIRHNKAPYAPANLSPGGTATPVLLAGTTPAVKWTFSDPDSGDYQSAYYVSLYNASNALVYESGWVSGSANSFTLPAGKLSRGAVYSWKVQVKDSRGAISPFSPALLIKANTMPTLNITAYTDGQSIPDNILSFAWTYSDGDSQTQNKYQVVGTKDNWQTWAYDSGERSGTALTFTTPPLSNGLWSFAVRVFDGLEWSDWKYRSNLNLPNSFEPNDTQAQATPLLYSNTYTTYISTATDIDFFTYKAGTTGVDRVQLTPATGKNYDVYVYDASNTLLAAGIRGAGQTENIIYEVTAGQMYYIKIIGVGGDYSSSATYSLTAAPVLFKYQTDYQYDDNGNIKSKTITRIN